MNKALYFDMDGTMVDFYNQPNWLDSIIKGHTKPYREAKPLTNMRQLSKELNALQALGFTIGIVTWVSKDCNDDYKRRIEKAKKDWLKNHLGSVVWDEIHVLDYGTNKSKSVEFPNGILFDDEESNREEWDGMAFDENSIFDVLEQIKVNLKALEMLQEYQKVANGIMADAENAIDLLNDDFDRFCLDNNVDADLVLDMFYGEIEQAIIRLFNIGRG